jgi:hydrogenase/urease accessory protein HupE
MLTGRRSWPRERDCSHTQNAFLFAAVTLHVTGIAAGLSISKLVGEPVLRATGGLVVIGGVALIAGLA